MKPFFFFALISLLLSAGSLSYAAPLKPRLLVLTDISTWEPDDHESLIRLMVHADMFEIEGIVVTTGWSMDNVIDAYEKDLPNLLKRSNQSGFKKNNL